MTEISVSDAEMLAIIKGDFREYRYAVAPSGRIGVCYIAKPSVVYTCASVADERAAA